jgi:hypothetical protein
VLRRPPVHKAQNRNVLLLAGKACNKLPAYGRKKACNPAGPRPVMMTVIFLQGCRARVQYVQFGDLPLQLIVERALFISISKFARSLVTCHCSLVSCHCSLVSCHCSLVSCHCSLINVSPRTTTTRTTTTRTTTTKQNLDPRCTYVQTRVKSSNGR